MSQAAAFGGGKGSGEDNGGGKKGKAAAAVKNSDDSLSSSSIGEESSDDNNEVDAPPSSDALDCMASLEASLPMKRGLSSSYDGKSKSFGNLSEIGIEDEDGKVDLGKKEHITNKRRRLHISHQLHHHNKSLHAGANISQSSSMPSFSTLHKNDDNNDDDDEEGKKKGYDAEDENEEEKGDEK